MIRNSATAWRGMRGWLILISLLWLGLLTLAVVYIVELFSRPEVESFFTTEQAQTGAIAFNQNCASCHGANLQGISAPALVGDTFLTRWSGQSVASLYEYTHSQMPPGRGGSLSDETYAETVAYVLHRNGLPSGERALTPGAARLNSLAITMNDTTQVDATAPAPILQSSGQQPQQAQQSNSRQTEGALTPSDAEPTTHLASTGQQVYKRWCAACHGADGGGGIGLALENNPRLEDATWTIRRISIGGLGMPTFAPQLSSSEIAEVTSFIRTNFNNDYGAVDANTVNDVVSTLDPEKLHPVTSNLAEAPLGEERYVQLCAACHGLQGGGEVGPPLAGNRNLGNAQLVVNTILYGRGIMPPFSLYSNLELAEIASYIRNEWGNSYASVDPDMVQTYRPTLNAELDSSPISQINSTNQNSMRTQSSSQNDSQNQNKSENSAAQNRNVESQPQQENHTEQAIPSVQNENTNAEPGGEE